MVVLKEIMKLHGSLKNNLECQWLALLLLKHNCSLPINSLIKFIDKGLEWE